MLQHYIYPILLARGPDGQALQESEFYFDPLYALRSAKMMRWNVKSSS